MIMIYNKEIFVAVSGAIRKVHSEITVSNKKIFRFPDVVDNFVCFGVERVQGWEVIVLYKCMFVDRCGLLCIYLC